MEISDVCGLEKMVVYRLQSNGYTEEKTAGRTEAVHQRKTGQRKR